MKKEKENEKVNANEIGVTIRVDNKVIEKVRSGEDKGKYCKLA